MEAYFKSIDTEMDNLCKKLEPLAFKKTKEYDYDETDFYKPVSQYFHDKPTMTDFGLDEKTYSMCNVLPDRYTNEYTESDRKRCDQNQHVKDLYIRYLLYKSIKNNGDQTVRDLINWCYVKPNIIYNKKLKLPVYKKCGNIVTYLYEFSMEQLMTIA